MREEEGISRSIAVVKGCIAEAGGGQPEMSALLHQGNSHMFTQQPISENRGRFTLSHQNTPRPDHAPGSRLDAESVEEE